jgi:hypothetical protein
MVQGDAAFVNIGRVLQGSNWARVSGGGCRVASKSGLF